MKTAVFMVALSASALAAALGDIQMAAVLMPLAYGVAVWRNGISASLASVAHIISILANPSAVYVFLNSAVAALAAAPLSKRPAAVPVALAAALAVWLLPQILSTVRDVVALVSALPYLVPLIAALFIIFLRKL